MLSSFLHFLNWVVCSLVFNFWSSLYIIGINHLSNE
jgi:hypothetical protein